MGADMRVGDADDSMKKASGDSDGREGVESSDDIRIIDEAGSASAEPLDDLFDDPEGWMSERENYWVTEPIVYAPTRESWLRHQLARVAGFLRLAGLGSLKVKLDPDVPDSEWTRLYEEEFGTPLMKEIVFEDVRFVTEEELKRMPGHRCESPSCQLCRVFYGYPVAPAGVLAECPPEHREEPRVQTAATEAPTPSVASVGRPERSRPLPLERRLDAEPGA
jgi:hypothetical protein